MSRRLAGRTQNNRRLLSKIFKLGIKPKKIASNLYSYSFDAPMMKIHESSLEIELSAKDMKTRKIFTKVKSGYTSNILTKLDHY